MAKKAAKKVATKRVAATKKPNSNSRSGRLIAPENGVTVRMYRQGLGDCFLLAFGGPKKRTGKHETSYVLIDCGVHKRQSEGTDRLSRVMENVLKATDGNLQVVVATHEHQDHLSGFVQKGSPFLDSNTITIRELWVAWTEQLGDELADRLRKRRGTARSIIEQAIKHLETSRLQAAGSPNEIGLEVLEQRLKTLSDFEDLNTIEGHDDGAEDETAALKLIQTKLEENPEIAGRGLSRLLRPSGVSSQPVALSAASANRKKPSSNELAIGILQAHADQVQYCRPGDQRQIEGVPAVRVHVLGPPHDEDSLKKDLPTKAPGGHEYKEVYLASSGSPNSFEHSPAFSTMAATQEIPLVKSRYPFDDRRGRQFDFTNDAHRAESLNLLPQETREIIEKAYLAEDWRRIDHEWLAAACDLALKLDSDTNNTSLVLAFEWNSQVLLFCGDAQVGNWLSWRDQKYLDGQGKRTISVDDLLERTVLYKVGHHGSHNATLKRDPRTTTSANPFGEPYGLELMRDIIAMIPVDRDAAEKKMPGPWEMPYLPLYQRLRQKAHRRVLRADAIPNVRPLGADEQEDLVPNSEEMKDVPNLAKAKWRRSTETFPNSNDPVFYEIEFRSE